MMIGMLYSTMNPLFFSAGAYDNLREVFIMPLISIKYLMYCRPSTKKIVDCNVYESSARKVKSANRVQLPTKAVAFTFAQTHLGKA